MVISNKIEIRNCSGKGKGLFAKEKIVQKEKLLHFEGKIDDDKNTIDLPCKYFSRSFISPLIIILQQKPQSYLLWV
jgi:hypothetical protein